MLNNLIRGNNFEDVIIPNVINKNPESANLQIILEYRAISSRIIDFDIDRDRNSDIEILKFIYKRFLLADLYIFPDMEGQRDKILFTIKFINFHGIGAQSIKTVNI
jgi:hypothetical protein